MRLESVGKRYGLRRPWVIRDVSRDVAAGRLIRVEGPNGAGKSTLLQVVAGVLVPSAGRVTGRPRAAYVPERFPAGLAFPVRDYLRHMARIHGLPPAAVAPAAEEWLGRLGAAEYAAAPLRTLSKGMCQKVALAQALLARPELLVLDEAWTGLDQAARRTLDAAVAERVAAGGTVLFVDHDEARLAGRADEVWELAGAHVTVSEQPALVKASAPAATVLIELTGELPDPQLLPGVVAVAHDAGLVRITVAESDSDAVLRDLLARDSVHVRAVHSDQAAPS